MVLQLACFLMSDVSLLSVFSDIELQVQQCLEISPHFQLEKEIGTCWLTEFISLQVQ